MDCFEKVERSGTILTYITVDMMRAIAKVQDEVVLSKLYAYCDDCLTMYPIKEMHLEELPLDIMSEYAKRGKDVVFKVRTQAVKLICQSCRELL